MLSKWHPETQHDCGSAEPKCHTLSRTVPARCRIVGNNSTPAVPGESLPPLELYNSSYQLHQSVMIHDTCSVKYCLDKHSVPPQHWPLLPTVALAMPHSLRLALTQCTVSVVQCTLSGRGR